MAMTRHLSVVSGDTKTLQFVLRNSAGDPVDVTDYVPRMQVRSGYDLSLAPLIDLSLGSGIECADPLAGVYDVQFDAALEPGEYPYDFETTTPSDVRTTHVTGVLEVRKKVTSVA